jgi:hypothetical protein
MQNAFARMSGPHGVLEGYSRGTQGVPAWMQKAFSRMSGQISLSADGLVERRLAVPALHAIRSSTVTWQWRHAG